MSEQTGSKEMKRVPLGISDFKEVIAGDYLYVDKTLFIKEIIDKGDKVLLIPRPRRFGKTLNLSMLRYFYDCIPDTLSPGSPPPLRGADTPKPLQNHLFSALAIHNTDKKYMDKMGKHPVMFLSFKDIKNSNWNECLDNIKSLIQEEYIKHYYLLDDESLTPPEKTYFKKITDLTGNKVDYGNSLKMLLIFLNRYYSSPAVILIDEYDAPIHAGYTFDYYEEIINFMRSFLSGGLKDTSQYLEKAVLTGIMRIAKESIFSGLNNLGVYTLLADEFSDKFGFTENEVEALLKDFQLVHKYDDVKEWYNGYRFGETVIYNPWSIISFLSSKSKALEPYWLNTSNNQIVETLLSKGGKELKEELEQLLRGESIEKVIENNIILKDVSRRENLLWSFLLLGGYLKQTAKRKDDTAGETYYTLAIPNKEVRTTYTRIVDHYFTAKIENKTHETMINALINGDVPLFGRMLRRVVTAVFSYHDFGGEPEKVYHAFVAGLLVWISGTHEVKSNRESGFGRYDIMIIPHDAAQPGYVIEFKTVDQEENETVEAAIQAALNQIEEKEYETELIQRGIQNRIKLAIVFKGKEVHIKPLRRLHEHLGNTI